MAERNPSRASRNSGFIPLDGGSNVEMADIPLTKMKSSASTGARRPNQGISSGYEAYNDATNEKGPDPRNPSGGRRRKTGPERPKRRGTGDEIQLNALGRLYEKIVGFSVITRYLVYVAPVGLLLAVPLIVLALTGHKEDITVGNVQSEGKDKDGKTITIWINGPPLFNVFFWVEISWLTLWAGKIVAWALPKIFMFLCGIVSAGVRKYATVLHNLNIPLSLFFWGLASFLSFKGLFNESIRWISIVGNILGALFVSSGVLLIEKALVQLIGVTYHQRSFANRIRESKHEVRLLGLLYEASRTLFPMYCEEFAEEDYVINDSIDIMLRKRAGRKRAGSATPMRIIGDVGRFGGKVTSVFGNLASEITGKNVFNPNSSHSIIVEALEKRLPSEALARRIWLSFVCEGRDALYLEDFYEVLGPEYTTEAEEAFAIIDADLNGDISLDEMILKVVDIGKERKAINEGMKDIGQALRAFDKVLLFVVLIITVFIFLAFFQSSFLTTLTTAGTALLSLSFVFAVTTQEFLGSCIFLFVKHPYDVGDRVVINGVQMLVDRISLLYTIFSRTDKMQTVQVPNIQLNNLWVDNVTRSKAMSESLEINVSFDTSFEDVELLRLEMERFVRAPENARDFKPDFTIGVGGVGDLDKLILKFSIQHKSNWHNEAVRATRRSKFMCALALALKKVPIYAPGGGSEALGAPGNPSYSVTVSDAFAAKSRDDVAKAKEEARMVPTKSEQTAKEHQQAEQQAISELNTLPIHIETVTSLWDSRDEQTVTSPVDGEDPEEAQRNREIQHMRNDLRKKESQRGRRKAGEGISAMTPTTTDTSYPSQTMGNTRLETFDEEANIDTPPTFYPQRHGEASSSQARAAAGRDDEDETELRSSMSIRSGGVHRGPSWGYRGPRGGTPERR